MKKYRRRIKYCLVVAVMIAIVVIADQITVRTPRIPSFTKIEASMTQVDMTWKKVPGVKTYQLKRIDKTAEEEHYTILTETSDTHFVDQTVTRGHYYKYYIKANRGSMILKTNKKKIKLKDRGTPKPVLTTDGKLVTLSFTGEAGRSYCIYRKNQDASYKLLTEIQAEETELSYQDRDVKKGETYTYTIQIVKRGEVTTYFGEIDEKGTSITVE